MQAGINIGVAAMQLYRPAGGVLRQTTEFVTLANDATLQISTRARGLVYLDAASLGQCALYSVDGAASTLIAGSSTYFGTTAGTASKFNVYASGGILLVQNKSGSSSSIAVIVLG